MPAKVLTPSAWTTLEQMPQIGWQAEMGPSLSLGCTRIIELLVSLWFRRSYESERQRVTNVGTGTLENAASLFLELLNRVLLPRRRSGNRLRGDVGIASRCAGRR
jgi:hypothetical protein